MYKNLRFSFIVMLITAAGYNSQAQNTNSSDELLIAGKSAISIDKDYPKAINLLRKAYVLSPEYTDVSILLGRAYQLNSNTDSARYFFTKALVKEPANADLLNYLTGLEYDAGNTEKSISYMDSALSYNPRTEDLLLKKASMQYELKNYEASQQTINTLLDVNPKNEKALRLNNQLSMVTASNKVSLYYDYSHFDNIFNPWHSTSLSYQRNTGIGALIGRVNYANRGNGIDGYQYELESYPVFSKSLYGNFAVAANSGDPVFPKFTAKGALYKALGSFEIEGGLRFVEVPDQNFMIYNAGVSKYLANFLLNFKTYLSDFDGASGQGFQFSSRYFYGENPDDIFILGAGTGVAPDLSNRNLGIGNIANLSGRRIFSEYRRVVGGKNILSLLANYGYEEYTPTRSANQYSIGFGYQRKF